MTTLITDDECSRLLSMREAVGVIENAFRMDGRGAVENPPRFRMPSKDGVEFQFGIAKLHETRVMGYKVGSPQLRRWIFLYEMGENALLAVLHARHLSRLRTGATSAVAVKYLSPPDASIVGMYGTGRQAEAQLEAICEVRSIREAHVYSRDDAKRKTFADKMSAALGISVVPTETPEQVARKADIVVTMTSSVVPVLFGEWVTRPTLLLCVGANHLFDREIDQDLVSSAHLVVVGEIETARAESGDLLHPAAHGLLRWDDVKELGSFVSGSIPAPQFSSGTIIFESHGLAMQDVAIAARTYELAVKQGLGSPIDL